MENVFLILFSGVFLALLFLIKARNKISMIIVGIQIISLAIAFFNFPTINRLVAYYAFGFSILLCVLYPFLSDKKNPFGKVWIWTFALPALMVFLFSVLHLPGGNIIRMASLIPVLFFIYSLFRYQNYKYELAIMSIIVADCAVKFLTILN